MLRDVVAVRALAGWRLEVGFDDGTEGVVNVSELIPFRGVFARLEDPTFFASVAIHPELGVVCWPNGADLDSDVLHFEVLRARLGPDGGHL